MLLTVLQLGTIVFFLLFDNKTHNELIITRQIFRRLLFSSTIIKVFVTKSVSFTYVCVSAKKSAVAIVKLIKKFMHLMFEIWIFYILNICLLIVQHLFLILRLSIRNSNTNVLARSFPLSNTLYTTYMYNVTYTSTVFVL